MGSYAYCWLDDFKVGSTDEYIDAWLMSLFRPSDKIITSSLPINFPSNLDYYRKEMKDYPDLKVIYYEAPVYIIRDRLRVLGYDLETAKVGFQAWISAEKDHYFELATQKESKEKNIIDSQLSDHYRRQAEILSNFSPDKWIENLKTIHYSHINKGYWNLDEGPYKETDIGFMLSFNWYGLTECPTLIPLRLAIEAFENSRKFIYDLTELVWGDYYSYDDDSVLFGDEISEIEFNSSSKIIILTEGKTDAWILSEVFNILYPHLKDYYFFLDFESTKFGGGVGNLANVVKAFAGAGIINNVIALFDNDTAAVSACKVFENISLPSNIIVHHLPELDLLKNYPTIGPSGLSTLDVNGMASSIELFLGEDILRNDEGTLMPIQWTGFDSSVGQYQGEVLDKSHLHTQFQDKLERSKKGEDVNWNDLIKIFKLIFGSFSKKTQNIICKRANIYYSK